MVNRSTEASQVVTLKQSNTRINPVKVRERIPANVRGLLGSKEATNSLCDVKAKIETPEHIRKHKVKLAPSEAVRQDQLRNIEEE